MTVLTLYVETHCIIPQKCCKVKVCFCLTGTFFLLGLQALYTDLTSHWLRINNKNNDYAVVCSIDTQAVLCRIHLWG